MTGAGADEFPRLRSEKFVDGARVLALDRLAGEDDRAAVDLIFRHTGAAVAAVDEVAQLGGVDQIVAAERRQQYRRAPHDVPADHDKATRVTLRLPLQGNLCKQEMRGRTADVDADRGEYEIVLRRDRSRDG